MKPKEDQIKRLETLEALEAENQKWCPTDSGRVRMDRLREIAELRSILKQ